MVRADVAEEARGRAGVQASKAGAGKLGAGLASLLIVAGSVFLALYRTRPPAAVAATAPPAVFSAERAAAHVEAMARAPHPVGSSEHAAVRDRLVAALAALGLSPEVQTAAAVSDRRTAPVAAGTVENVLARLKGTGGAKSVLLVAHYDSAPHAPGANDDASGVAAVLETMRALKAGPPPQNDVVALLTDGEEPGLLGAQAFVESHPWAADVGLVLNFDARGGGGPVLMYETSRGNRRLVEGLAHAVEGPVITNSLLSDLYKLLPNDTDFTVFRKAGLGGMNFAFIGEPTRYHMPLDDLAALNRSSLQHQGNYALSLARHFGGLDLARARDGGDAVYFDLLGGAVVRYPLSWALPLATVAGILFVVVVGAGVLRRRLSASGVLKGALFYTLVAAAVWFVVWAAWRVLLAVHGEYAAMPLGQTYNARLYLAAFAALTVAVSAALFVAARGRVGVQNLWAGAMLLWLLLTLATSLLLPGASYLFLWPLLSSLAALAATLFVRGLGDSSSPMRFAVLAAGALPGIVLLVPLVELIFTGLPISSAGIPMALTALLLGLLTPQLDYMTVTRRRLLPGAMLLVSAVFFAAGALTSSAAPGRPTPDSLLYALDADTGRAYWASADNRLDPWTSRFFTKEAKEVLLKDFFPLLKRSLFVGTAEAVALPAPEATLTADERAEGGRLVRVRVTSPRGASVVSVYLDPGVKVQSAAVNGRPVADGGAPWGLRYYALPPEGLELSLAVSPDAPFGMRVVDQTYGLPDVPGEPSTQRPDDRIPSLVPFSDTTQVGRSFKF